MTQAMHQILVVEDEPGIRAVLRVLLEAEGYRVVEADTAARARSRRARTSRTCCSSISACRTRTGST